MRLVPLSYNLRSLVVRRTATVLTVLGVGATVAVVAGVLALQQGFQRLFSESGSDEVVVFMRQGSTNEGDSVFSLERAEVLKKSIDAFALDDAGQPLVSGESYLAVRLFKLDGGETNVPVRGVQPMTFEIWGEALKIVEGRRFTPGTDEVIVGKKLVDRIRGCTVGDLIQFNTTPFRVVGVFDLDGPYTSEIWGDRNRLAEALERPIFNRIIGRVKPGVEIGYPEEAVLGGRNRDDPAAPALTGLALEMDEHPQVPCKVMTERQYLTSQTAMLAGVLLIMGGLLAWIMGIGAVFTATNTMLAALASRSHEIGILLSLGFRPFAIFLSFLFESLVLGLIGGVAGCLMALPINGIDTGTMNWNTFTEVAFAFRITPWVLGMAVALSLILGLVGGLWPALRAAYMRPTQALRRE